MQRKLNPIQDDILATTAIDYYIAGMEPLLYASNLGATPEQVHDTLRQALTHCRENHGRKGTGRKRKHASDKDRFAFHNAKRSKKGTAV